jgi:hypothetical protein
MRGCWAYGKSVTNYGDVLSYPFLVVCVAIFHVSYVRNKVGGFPGQAGYGMPCPGQPGSAPGQPGCALNRAMVLLTVWRKSGCGGSGGQLASMHGRDKP